MSMYILVVIGNCSDKTYPAVGGEIGSCIGCRKDDVRFYEGATNLQ